MILSKKCDLTIETIFMIFKYTLYNRVIFMHNELKITDMQTLESNKKTIEESINPISLYLPDFTTDSYKDAYSRINAIVIEGEQEAHDNYISIATLIPNELEELTKLARMEMKHKKGFTACGRNLGVVADMDFAKKFFSKLHGNFQVALEKGNLTTCLLIQAILIEAFAFLLITSI